MSKLNTLPQEILLNILKHLAGDKQSLRSLALTAKGFNPLAAEFIFRDIRVIVEIADLGPSSMYILLLRSITEKQELATYIVDVTLNWNDDNRALFNQDESYQKRKREGHIRANRLLERLPNLERLDIRSFRASTSPFVPTFLQVNPAHRLRKVVISDLNVTVNEVSSYLRQQGIRELHACYVDPAGTLDTRTLARINGEGNPGAAMSTLSLGMEHRTHLSASQLHSLLSIPSSVHTLWCPMPGREENPTLFRSPYPHMGQPLSPASIAYALSPLQNSLVKLHLDNSAKWPSHDLSRMDLSGFKVLEGLNVPSTCFFSSPSPQEPRQGVLKCLPKTLKELWIRFRSDSSFLFTQRELFTIFAKNRPAPKEPLSAHFLTRYRWVHEILEHKVDDLPLLHTIKVVETDEGFCQPIFLSFEKHDFPSDQQHAAALAGVVVTVSLRPKDGWRPLRRTR